MLLLTHLTLIFVCALPHEFVCVSVCVCARACVLVCVVNLMGQEVTDVVLCQ